MMRVTVWTAEFVCKVASVRWPVSAIRRAASTVSRSRISPISTTSGSSRNAARRAGAKPWVSVCTSRWLTRQPRWGWTYSMGSSIVRMCPFRSRLTRSTSAASVVLFPLPVAPVTRTRPCAQAGEAADRQWKVESLQIRDVAGDQAVRSRHRPTLPEGVAPGRAPRQEHRARRRAPASLRTALAAQPSAGCTRAVSSAPRRAARDLPGIAGRRQSGYAEERGA